MKYYLNKYGQKTGPYTPQELAALTVVPDDYVCPVGSDKMVAVSTIPELKGVITTFDEDITNQRKQEWLQAIGGIVLAAVIVALLVKFTSLQLKPILGVIAFFAAIVVEVRFSIVRYASIAVGCVAIILHPEMRLFVGGLVIGIAILAVILSPIVLSKYVRNALIGVGGALLVYILVAQNAIGSITALVGVVALLLAFAVLLNAVVYYNRYVRYGVTAVCGLALLAYMILALQALPAIVSLALIVGVAILYALIVDGIVYASEKGLERPIVTEQRK